MSFAEKLLDGLRATVEMRGDIDRVSDRVERMADDLLDHEKRLVRIETMIEMTRGAPSPSRPRRLK
jgi:hypothetical protein